MAKKKFSDKKKFRGVAILTVLVTLALLMALVTEISTKEFIRYKLALNERDALMAEGLAESGAKFAQLLLTLQEPLQSYFTNFAKMGIQMPAYTPWDLMPIDSGLLKGITDGSFMPSLGIGEEASNLPEKKVAENPEQKEDESKFFGPYVKPRGGYGGFRGHFTALVEDEEKKISIRNWSSLPLEKAWAIAQQLIRILSKPEHEKLFDGSTGDNQNVGPQQLVANIFDYVSDNENAIDINAPKDRFGRDTVGSKKNNYANMQNILPKRAPFDSMAELRLVPGMTDAIYQVLAKHISIYGESDKINILSASDEILGMVFYLCSQDKDTGPFTRPEFERELLLSWNQKKSEGNLKLSLEGIIEHLEQNSVAVNKEECEKNVGTQSKTFTVKSIATVGEVTRTLIMRVRSAGNIITPYQFQFL